jgi:AcrR family transcriptional regulator
MTGGERREQLVNVARSLFAEKGFAGASIEEIAARAGVSKPVVYEHFGGKQGIYAVVLDREVAALLDTLTTSLRSPGHPRIIVERTALAFLEYIDNNHDGFRVLVRDSPIAAASGPFQSMLGDIATRVEDLLADQFAHRDLDPATAQIYAQMLVGMIAFTGQWWLEERAPDKRIVAAHLTNLAWNGLRGMVRSPSPTPAIRDDAAPHPGDPAPTGQPR